MPFVHIFHGRDFNQERIEHLGDSVHRALMEAFDVPPDDMFQAFSVHTAGSQLRVTPAFLGIRHSADAVFVQITCAPGRTDERRRTLLAAIVAHAHAMADVNPEDVIINLVESSRENWSFGNDLAQLAA
ncbi:MAG: tautomerase family protein [Roseateles sp.]|uniref:tautomerase family protein n=1 Tax=Roseateles sp. TaxID=1971397 RepID=UPI004036B939